MEGNHVVISLEEYNRLYESDRQLKEFNASISIDKDWSDRHKVVIHPTPAMKDTIIAFVNKNLPGHTVDDYYMSQGFESATNMLKALAVQELLEPTSSKDENWKDLDEKELRGNL